MASGALVTVTVKPPAPIGIFGEWTGDTNRPAAVKVGELTGNDVDVCAELCPGMLNVLAGGAIRA